MKLPGEVWNWRATPTTGIGLRSRSKQLAGDLLGSASDVVLTELKDEELLKLVALDLNAATRERG